MIFFGGCGHGHSNTFFHRDKTMRFPNNYRTTNEKTTLVLFKKCSSSFWGSQVRCVPKSLGMLLLPLFLIPSNIQSSYVYNCHWNILEPLPSQKRDIKCSLSAAVPTLGQCSKKCKLQNLSASLLKVHSIELEV